MRLLLTYHVCAPKITCSEETVTENHSIMTSYNISMTCSLYTVLQTMTNFHLCTITFCRVSSHDAAMKPKLSRYWSECSRRSGSELVTSSPFCPPILLIQSYTATPMMYTSGITPRTAQLRKWSLRSIWSITYKFSFPTNTKTRAAHKNKLAQMILNTEYSSL